MSGTAPTLRWKELIVEQKDELKNLMSTNNSLLKNQKFYEITKQYFNDVQNEPDLSNEINVFETYKLAFKFMFYGIARDAVGMPDIGSKHLQRAVACFQKLGDKANEGNCWTNASVCHSHMGDNDCAYDSIKRAMEISEQVRDAQSFALRSQNAGSLLAKMGQEEKALELINRTLATLEKNPKNSNLIPNLKKKKAGVLIKMNKLEEAAEIAQQVLDSGQDDPFQKGQFLFMMQNIYTKMNKPEEAEKYSQRLKEVEETLSEETRPMIREEVLETEEDARSKVEELLQKFPGIRTSFSPQIVKGMSPYTGTPSPANSASKSEESTSKWRVLRILSFCQKMKRPKESVDFYKSSLDMIEKQLAIEVTKPNSTNSVQNMEKEDKIRHLEEELVSIVRNLVLLLIGRKEHWAAYDVCEQGRSVALLHQALQKYNNSLSKFFEKQPEIKSKIYYSLKDEDIQAAFTKNMFFTVTAIAASRNATIISYYRIDDCTFFVWVVNNKKQGFYKLLTIFEHKILEIISQTSLLGKVLSSGIIDPNSTDYAEQNKQLKGNLTLLNKYFIDPIGHIIPKDENQELIVIGDGIFSRIPWYCLFDETSNKYLVEKHTISVIPSVKCIEVFDRFSRISKEKHKIDKISSPTSILISQQQTNDTSDKEKMKIFAERKQTNEKISKILAKKYGQKSILKTIQSTDPKNLSDTKESSIKALSTQSCNILHLLCPIDLVSGAMTLGQQETEASNISLQAFEELDLAGTELLVAPECFAADDDEIGIKKNSALGNAVAQSNIFNFFRGLAETGVASCLYSLWNPDITSPATQQLLINFYENLAAGQKKMHAARNAILKQFQQSPNFPSMWGCFLFYGSGIDPIENSGK